MAANWISRFQKRRQTPRFYWLAGCAQHSDPRVVSSPRSGIVRNLRGTLVRFANLDSTRQRLTGFKWEVKRNWNFRRNDIETGKSRNQLLLLLFRRETFESGPREHGIFCVFSERWDSHNSSYCRLHSAAPQTLRDATCRKFHHSWLLFECPFQLPTRRLLARPVPVDATSIADCPANHSGALRTLYRANLLVRSGYS